MSNKITQRDAFWNRVFEIAKSDKDVVVVSADMGAPSLDRFWTDLSSQIINAGIAEQNAITIASGLALSGKKVFVYAIAPFITLRCLEQIRVECGLMKIPLTIVGVGAGVGYVDSGPTHHLIEDIGIMRSIPGMQINSITDTVMASAVADISCGMDRPNYVRLERQVFPDIYNNDTDFSNGLAILREGRDFYILSTGCMTHTALELADELGAKGVDAGVIDIYTLPINEDLLISSIQEAGLLITLEEHLLPGGLGSAVCEVLVDRGHLIPVKRIGMSAKNGYCYKYGGREEIRAYYGMDREGIVKQVIDSIGC